MAKKKKMNIGKMLRVPQEHLLDKWDDLLYWITDNKKLLMIGGLALLVASLAFFQWRTKVAEFKMLKVAYENQEKKLKETEKKLKSVKIAKNVVTTIERVKMPDGTVKEVEKTIDLTKTDSSTSSLSTSESSSHVVLPKFGQTFEIEVMGQVTGFSGTTDIERLKVGAGAQLLGPVWMKADYQLTNKTWAGLSLKF